MGNWEHGGDALGTVKDGSSCDEVDGFERGCDPLGTVKSGSLCDELCDCFIVIFWVPYKVHNFVMSWVTLFPLGAVLHKIP